MTACSYCGHEFDAEAARRQCRHGCGMAGGCRAVKCPRCGYEMPEEPAIFARLRAWVQRRRDGKDSKDKEDSPW